MNKLSLYDTLGMFLPGAFLAYGLYFCNQNWHFIDLPFKIDTNVLLVAVVCLILGASLFALSFYLFPKRWMQKCFGLYDKVGKIYYSIELSSVWDSSVLDPLLQDEHIKYHFMSKEEYNRASEDEKALAIENQETIYDYAYYLLQNEGKNGAVVSNQSLYFFFRQSFLAILILTILCVVLNGLSIALNWSSSYPIWAQFLTLIGLAFLARSLARHYRKRMVRNLYWSYFIFLQQKKKAQ